MEVGVRACVQRKERPVTSGAGWNGCLPPSVGGSGPGVVARSVLELEGASLIRV